MSKTKHRQTPRYWSISRISQFSTPSSCYSYNINSKPRIQKQLQFASLFRLVCSKLSIYFATKIDGNFNEKFMSCISAVRREERETKWRQRKVKRMCQLVRKLYAPCTAGIVVYYVADLAFWQSICPSPHLYLSVRSICRYTYNNIE